MKSLFALPLAIAFFSKPMVEKYEGGSRYHSHLILTLYQDSTFTYSTWYHSSPKTTRIFKGIWHKSPRKLVLDSRKGSKLFQHEMFSLNGDTLRLYSKEDSIKNPRFYKEYFTLIRQR